MLRRLLLILAFLAGVVPSAYAQTKPATLAPTNAKFVSISCGGSVGTSGSVLTGGSPCAWSATPTITSLTLATANSTFIADAAATTALRNSTTGQLFRVYNTFTDASNGEWMDIGVFSANLFGVVVQANGTGQSRNLVLGTQSSSGTIAFRIGGVAVWMINASGHLTDNGAHGLVVGAATGGASANVVNVAGAYQVNGVAVTSGSTHLSAGSGMAVGNVGANSCGTTAATIAGNNNAFVITVGATNGTQCRVTFTVTAANEWDCTVTDQTQTIATRSTPVDTTHADFLGAFAAADKVAGICFPR